MKFTCYTNNDRAPIWISLTSDLFRDESIELSFIDVATDRPIPTFKLNRGAFSASRPKLPGHGKYNSIMFIDGPAASAQDLEKLQTEIGLKKSTDSGIVSIQLLDVPFESLIPSTPGVNSSLRQVLSQARRSDGVILTMEASAEALRCYWLGPVSTFFSCQFDFDPDRSSQLAQSHSLGEAIAFTAAIDSVLQSAQVWKPISTVCANVAAETKFLGIDPQSQAIDKVGVSLKLLMPAFEL